MVAFCLLCDTVFMGLRIGLVTGEFPPMQGGVGAFTRELATALTNAGSEVHIITSYKARPQDDAPRSQSFPGIINRLEALQEPIDLGFAKLHPRGRRWRWGDMRMIADITLRYNLDLVNIQYQAAAFNMWSGAINLLPWRLRHLASTVVTFHDLRVPYLFPKAGRLRESAISFMAQHADGVIVTNRADHQALASSLGNKVCRIPIGSNIEAYSPHAIELDEVRESLGLTAENFLLGYFGFLNDSKGADDLIKALAQLDERFHVVFIGGRTGASDSVNNRAFFANLDRLISAFGLDSRVHWTGYLTPSRVSTYLHAIDLMVMPYRDGASLRRGTLMAAFAHGRPLITTEPDHDVPELVHGESVWFTPIGQPSRLYHAILNLAQDEALRQKLGQNAQEVSKLFTWDKIAADTLSFYQSCIAVNNRPLRQ